MKDRPADTSPAPFGPTLRDGAVTFRAWSPGARRLQVALEPGSAHQRWLPLSRLEDGYWEATVDGVGAGARYFLQRDDRRPQPDPASAFQPAGVFGPSEVIDHDAYRWQHESWRGVPADELVLYEVHVGTFSAARSYDGLRERLAELAELGITGIKLMPLATSAGRHNWGYDGVFHLAPFPPYGRPAQLQRLVDAAHGQGIAVLVDVVTNHFGPEGNAMWTLARSFFHRESNTAWGPGPCFDKEPVQRYFEQMAEHFARHYRVDGLRVDAVHAIPHPERRPHLERLRRGLERSAPPNMRLHLMLESVDNEASLLGQPQSGRVTVSQLNFDYQRATHRLLSGERHMEYGEADDDGTMLCLILARGLAFAGDFSAQRHRIVGESFDALPWSTLIAYLVNHDTAGNRYLGQRLQELISPQLFRAATALLLLHPATPYLFMGQEWASRRRFHFFTDFPEALGRRVSEGRLRGFHEVDPQRCSERAPGPQEPGALDASTLDWSEREEPACAAHLALTRELLALRRQHRPLMAPSTKGCRAWQQGHAFFAEISRRDGRGSYRLVANLGEESVAWDEGYEVLFATEQREALGAGVLPPLVTVLGRRGANAHE